ncbi:tRNA glutamyl-Q(34) synthetase GluQRS [Pseudaestuariivita sp.]|uniref:tRNA glutamyl-Q(34) synthetase GluQRS n=1 Tax=Pseudaestuariivita sp. TaxID=2211669 RepID=UPI00405895ED
MTRVTRFAPSPTGPLHLGHAYSALVAAEAAGDNGMFHLRIDDLDQNRSRPAWEAQIFDDLAWLGLTWQVPVMRQSERTARYAAALDALWARGLLYVCTCTRRDIAEAASAPQEGAPHHGPDGLIYPGTCRNAQPRTGSRPEGVLRLDWNAADLPNLSWREHGATQTVTTRELREEVGDIVVARRDMAASYHLAVVLDDADQGVTLVTRGADLAPATKIHRALQHLLNLPVPGYAHHRLVRDETGKRLAKRDDARSIAAFRAEGHTPAEIARMAGL